MKMCIFAPAEGLLVTLPCPSVCGMLTMRFIPSVGSKSVPAVQLPMLAQARPPRRTIYSARRRGRVGNVSHQLPSPPGPAAVRPLCSHSPFLQVAEHRVEAVEQLPVELAKVQLEELLHIPSPLFEYMMNICPLSAGGVPSRIRRPEQNEERASEPNSL